MKSKRLFEISAMNIVLCLLVVMIHVTSEPVSGYQRSSLPFAVVCILQRSIHFVVQGFIFLSGLKLMKSRSRESYPAFCLDRFRRIVLPYLLWVLIYYAYFISIGWMEFDGKELIRYLFVGNLVSPFYFVIIIVQFYLMTPLWRWLTDHIRPLPLCLGALAVTLICQKYLPQILATAGIESFRYNDRVFTTYLVFWIAGCEAGLHYGRFRCWVMEHGKHIVVTFAITFCGAVIPYYFAMATGRYYPWVELVRVFYCGAAILLLYRICCAAPAPEGRRADFFRTLDHATYHIYLIHCLPIQEVNRRLTAWGITSLTVRYGIRIVIVYTVTVGACMLYQKWKGTRFRCADFRGG